LPAYHGRSWLPVLTDPATEIRDAHFASHTFHEIQMYYPMRVVRDHEWKLIWNIAHPLPYPFATDLWVASSWQAQFRRSLDAPYGQKTVAEYMQRPRFELYHLAEDPDESRNLADDPAHAATLLEYQQKLKALQQEYDDPWITKWDYE
jgi:N-sulfoglucosamine sulfohydrolase